MTDATKRALTIIRDHGPIRPREFADLMWPDSPGHNRYSKCGPKGSHRGGGMYLAAGGYLGKLRRRGLIRYEDHYLSGWWLGYVLTDEGKKALEGA